jgi:oxygen-independent coproporphyrinogen-3 oxidase
MGPMSEQTRTAPAPPGIGLYVHLPFCRARCAYCDFNTYAGLEELMPAYVEALRQEMARVAGRGDPHPITTLYLGGGTPSLLPLPLMARILEGVAATFELDPRAEVSVEANPGTVSEEYLRGLRRLGVNRLSLGVQAAHDEELALLGRIHTWAQAREAVTQARRAGFENLSLDLIYGLPGQTEDSWKTTLARALRLKPAHLSLYGLSVEPGTPLARAIARGELPVPDPDRAAEMYERAEETLAAAGFFHYELSNWAGGAAQGSTWWPAGATSSEGVSPWVCRHNLVYWRNEPWLGLGAGAHSWWRGARRANRAHPRAYVDALAAGRSAVAEREPIARRLEMGETMMMRLRLAEGVRAADFRARFGVALEDVFGAPLKDLVQVGLLAWDGRAARLTARGRLLGNRVFERFLPE